MAARSNPLSTLLAFQNTAKKGTRLTVRTMAHSALSSPMVLKNPSNTIIPKLVYGTAWKKDRTADLVYQALKAGFRGIDTAAQPRHYQENLVGDGIRRAINEGIVNREELYVRISFILSQVGRGSNQFS
jgi:diketogulonate reductase-like aldo/keto reductase